MMTTEGNRAELINAINIANDLFEELDDQDTFHVSASRLVTTGGSLIYWEVDFSSLLPDNMIHLVTENSPRHESMNEEQMADFILSKWRTEMDVTFEDEWEGVEEEDDGAGSRSIELTLGNDVTPPRPPRSTTTSRPSEKPRRAATGRPPRRNTHTEKGKS